MIKNNYFLLSYCILTLVASALCENAENKIKQEQVYEQDLTDTFKIDGSSQGIQKVNLKCGAESMQIMLETEQDFTGVMYTRGSFYKQSAPCFVKSEKTSNIRSLEMKFNFDQCQTQQEGDVYTNIVVIQNDPELITPGDSAFSLECDFRQPRNVNVEGNFETRERTVSGSRITLTSPDPSYTSNSLDDKDTVHNATDTVTYKPSESVNIIGNKKVQGSVEEVAIGDEIIGSVLKDEL
ncbi:uncharacterized protein LOC129939540 [Eupeodes corollae]|uniref:uncharacterized protein LOC129939540 n=1 Tax=Eupeodes corollae TaxID=290404 RepID=UPI002490D788|nr:uncharacterized protein LOC129939540 [Eupeodes corollae]XP_055903557.1 uncharacterized protein LOC129939540 [Eupeodes corollae]